MIAAIFAFIFAEIVNPFNELVGTLWEHRALVLGTAIKGAVAAVALVGLGVVGTYLLLKFRGRLKAKTARKIFHEKFVAQIVGKKQAYQRGEPVRFRSRFNGSLTSGFFANIITAPRIPVGIDVTRYRTFSTTTPNISEDGRSEGP